MSKDVYFVDFEYCRLFLGCKPRDKWGNNGWIDF